MTFSGDLHAKRSPRKFYTRLDISLHSTAGDCWVVCHGKVFDLSALIAASDSPLAIPLIRSAGSDISHWFVLGEDGQLSPKTVMNLPQSKRRVSYRFHIFRL